MSKIYLGVAIAFLATISVSGLSTTRYKVQKKQPVVFVIDSLPVNSGVIWYQILNPFTCTIEDSDIYKVDILWDKTQMEAMGFDTANVDSVFFITTRLYHNRTPEERKIPSWQTMHVKKEKIYLKDSDLPYTGPFVSTYYSGRRSATGYFKDGKLTDTFTIYYADGITIRWKEIYRDGVRDGMHVEYFPNGKVKLTGKVINGKREGTWKEYYSTGALLEMYVYEADHLNYLPENKRAHKLYEFSKSDMHYNEMERAVADLTKCIAEKKDYAEAYFTRGLAEFALQRYDSSIQDFTKALEIEPFMEAAREQRILAVVALEKGFWLPELNESSENKSRRTLLTLVKELPQNEKQKLCEDLAFLRYCHRIIYSLSSVSILDMLHQTLDVEKLGEYCEKK